MDEQLNDHPGDYQWLWAYSRTSPPSNLTVIEEDDNPVVGRILGPDENVIKIVRAKPPRRPIGFRKDSEAR